MDFYEAGNSNLDILPLRSELDFQIKGLLAPERPRTAARKKIGYVKGSIGLNKKDIHSYIYGLKKDVMVAKVSSPKKSPKKHV
jgi:hypothetical protein